jgi:hypothetical protein
LLGRHSASAAWARQEVYQEIAAGSIMEMEIESARFPPGCQGVRNSRQQE